MPQDLGGISSRSIVGRFYETLEQSTGQNWAARASFDVSSDQASEEHKWLGASPAIREWVAGRHAKGLRENGFTIKNKKYEGSIIVSVDDIRRDKTGQIMVRVDEMADRVVVHRTVLATTLLTSNAACYDGKNFFATNHSEGKSGTLKNKLAVGDYSQFDVTETAPTAEEMAKAILTAIQHQYGFLDDQGEPINENSREFVVVVPVFLWAATVQAVKKNFLSTGSGVIDNPIPDDLKITVAVNPRLTTDLVFYVLRVDGRAKPFIYQTELPLEHQMIGEGSEREAEKDEWLFGVKIIHNIGYGLWQHALEITLS